MIARILVNLSFLTYCSTKCYDLEWYWVRIISVSVLVRFRFKVSKLSKTIGSYNLMPHICFTFESVPSNDLRGFTSCVWHIFLLLLRLLNLIFVSCYFVLDVVAVVDFHKYL